VIVENFRFYSVTIVAMFDDEEELTNEEILKLMEKPNPHGLEPFGPNWEKEMEMHPLFMDDVPSEVRDGI
jgi:hypothetical protein